MTKTVAIPDDLYAQLAMLARPFLDKEPADVIRRLVDREIGHAKAAGEGSSASADAGGFIDRAPRERGAVVDLDGTMIQADSVPDLCKQVMEYLYRHKHWDTVMRLAPYKTSAQRYLFAKTPKHPNGKDFFVEIQCHGLYVETHKNYQTAITQLARFVTKCGLTLTYRGTSAS